MLVFGTLTYIVIIITILFQSPLLFCVFNHSCTPDTILVVLIHLIYHLIGIFTHSCDYDVHIYVGLELGPEFSTYPTPVVSVVLTCLNLPKYWSKICQELLSRHCQLARYCHFCHWHHQILLLIRPLLCMTYHRGICTSCLPSDQGLLKNQFFQNNCHYHPVLLWNPVEASHRFHLQFVF